MNSNFGFCIKNSHNTTLLVNEVVGNSWDALLISYSDNCTVIEDTISDNRDYGIWLVEASGNHIYHNAIWNSSENAYDDSSPNFWDDGVSLGNYWGGFEGGNEYCISGSGGSIDHYPYPIEAYHSVYVDHPKDIEYVIGTTGHNITWHPSDPFPDSYEILQNGTQEHAGIWDGSEIAVGVDGLTLGVYNYTLLVDDLNGTSASDSVLVKVIETTPPTINHPADIEYELGTTGHSITWSPSDVAPSGYEVYKNGSLVGAGAWNGSNFDIDIDGLEVGVYNYTLTVYDGSGNNSSDSVLVTVVDTISPTIDHPADIGYELGSTGNSITWAPSDLDPDYYDLLRNGNLIETTPWDGTAIIIDVDGQDIGVCNYTLIVYDGSGHSACDSVMVTVVDTTPPDIDSPEDIEYEFGSTGNLISWDPSDHVPYWYNVYRNGTIIDSAPWHGSYVVVDIDGLSLGIYNYTLVVQDGYEHSASDTVIVTVVDTTPPHIDSPSDLEYEFGSTGHSIAWHPSDADPASYEVLENGSLLYSGTVFGSEINISVDGLSIGAYNYMLVVHDGSGNTANDTVIVTVVDTTPPDIESPEDMEYELGSTGHELSWSASEAFPSSYQVLKDGDELDAGDWDGSDILQTVDGLSCGDHNYTLVLFDQYENMATDTVIVTVVDTTCPEMDHPDDMEFELGSSGWNITWHPTDLDLDFYEILRNGTSLQTGSCEDSEVIILLDIAEPGVFNYTLVVSDGSGNTASDSVMVTAVDTTSPAVDHPDDIEYEVGTTGHMITWNPSDLDPASYDVYRNTTLAYSGDWNGSEISVSADGLGTGVYSFRLVVEDGSGNTASDIVLVTVLQAPETTTTTGTTSPTTTTGLPQGPSPMLFLAVGGIAVVAAVVLILILLKRRKG